MKNRYVFVADLFVVSVAAFAAFLTRFDLAFLDRNPEFLPYLIAALLLKPPIFFVFGMYRRLWLYTSFRDLAVVAAGVVASAVALTAFVMILQPVDGFSRVVLLNDFILTMIGTGAVRVGIRAVNDMWRPDTGGGRGLQRLVLIIGAGNAGTMVAREMLRNPQLGMTPAGFLDDDPRKSGMYWGGLRVFGAVSALSDVVRDHRIDHVVIAMPTAPGDVLRKVLQQCRDSGVTSQTMPGVFELLDERLSLNRLRKVEIADLLRRAPARGSTHAAEAVAGRVVLITGAGGSIGSELARQTASAGPAHLVLLGHGENSLFDTEARLRDAFPSVRITTLIGDTRDEHRMSAIFDRCRPDVVFHAAAHKHVPLMEANPEEAVTNNIIGTRQILREALRVGTQRFVLISTDKAVMPTSIMGATKRVAEGLVRQAAHKSGKQFVVVRFGNVLGSRGSVVHTFSSQIERGGPITVTDPEMTRYFMTIPEAVHLVLQATAEGNGGELYILDMGQPVKVVDLARDMITLSGMTEEEIPIVFCGMRPGEKLHELLHDPGMETRPTSHPDIHEVFGGDPYLAMQLDPLVDELDAAARCGDVQSIERLLSKMIRGFTPAKAAEPQTRRTSDRPVREVRPRPS